MTKPYHVFISYATEDEEFAKELANALQWLGLSVWFAPIALQVFANERNTRDLVRILTDPHHKDRDEGPPLGLFDLDVSPKFLSAHETTVGAAGGGWKPSLQNRNGVGNTLIFVTSTGNAPKNPIEPAA